MSTLPLIVTRPRLARTVADKKAAPEKALRDLMLESNAITTAWRLNSLANFFSVPLYRALERQTGHTRSEYVILFCLAHHPKITAQDIAAIAGRPKNSISVAVSKLEKKLLISRSPSAADSRHLELTLTSAGQDVYRNLVPLLQQREGQMLAVLSTAERRRVDQILLKLGNNVSTWEEVNLSPDFGAVRTSASES